MTTTGLTDNFPDLCPRDVANSTGPACQDYDPTPLPRADWDNDGCKDDVEDSDDDNDQVLDVNDYVPVHLLRALHGQHGFQTPTNDLDGDGCRDTDEDVDDDADGPLTTSNDDCPTTRRDIRYLEPPAALTPTAMAGPIPTDDCPTQAGNSTLGGKNACPDTDGDGWSNADDAFPERSQRQWADADADGYGDNTAGPVTPDDCPISPRHFNG